MAENENNEEEVKIGTLPPDGTDPFEALEMWLATAGEFPDDWGILEQINVYAEQYGNHTVAGDDGHYGENGRLVAANDYPPYHFSKQVREYQTVCLYCPANCFAHQAVIPPACDCSIHNCCGKDVWRYEPGPLPTGAGPFDVGLN